MQKKHEKHVTSFLTRRLTATMAANKDKLNGELDETLQISLPIHAFDNTLLVDV